MDKPFSLRPYEETDLASLVKLIHTTSRAEGEPFLPTAEDLFERFHSPDIDPAQDVIVAEIPGAGIIGYADGILRGQPDEWRYLTRGSVLPAACGQGVGRALLERLWGRAQQLCEQIASPQIAFGTRVLTSQVRAIRLLERFGMRCIRVFFEMHRDLNQPIPALQIPDRLKILSWAGRRADREIWAAMNEAFSDHWNHTPESYESFEHRIHSRFNLEASFIAWDGDQVAGGSLNEMGPEAASRRSQNQGYVGLLFVRRPWRKHGLGKALLVKSMQHAQVLGHDSIGLNVDSENTSSAVRLYESLGFSVALKRVIYEKRYLRSSASREDP